MLLTSLALAGVVTPSSESGLWTEPLRAAGLDPAAQVTIDAIDQGYRVHVWVSGGERLAIVTGPHDAATREDAARLARSLLVTARDPLDGMLPAPVAAAPPAPPPAAPKTTRSPPRSEPPPPPAPIVAPPEPAPLVAPLVAPPDPAPPAPPPLRTEAPLSEEERAALDADADGIARPAAPDRDRPPRLEVPPERPPAPPNGPRSRVTLGLGMRNEPLVGEDFDGLGAAVRVRGTRTLAAEVDAYVHLASEASTRAAADAELQAIAAADSASQYQVPVRYDAVAVDLLADWGIIPLTGRWAGGPHLQAGLSFRGQEHVQGRVEDGETRYADAGMVFVPAVAGAVAMEGWYADRVGLRARVLGRVAYEEEPYRGEWEITGISAGAQVLTPSAVVAFDVLVHL